MPIFVDHELRRAEIVTAATETLGNLGFAKFSLRAVGQRLGGSVTLVTHYFPTREALLTAILDRTLADARQMQDELRSVADPRARLEAAITYFLPIDDESTAIERARVALATQRNVDPTVADHLDQIDPCMRELIRAAIVDLVPAQRMEATVDLIRLWTAGMVLTKIEHPEIWTAERQVEALHEFRQLIDATAAA